MGLLGGKKIPGPWFPRWEKRIKGKPQIFSWAHRAPLAFKEGQKWVFFTKPSRSINFDFQFHKGMRRPHVYFPKVLDFPYFSRKWKNSSPGWEEKTISSLKHFHKWLQPLIERLKLHLFDVLGLFKSLRYGLTRFRSKLRHVAYLATRKNKNFLRSSLPERANDHVIGTHDLNDTLKGIYNRAGLSQPSFLMDNPDWDVGPTDK